ncbi:MAG: DUF2804 domain-containing protein [Bacilli bacterium]|nr:DUF2804 domain-containing protein [Bacilli bacterium]
MQVELVKGPLLNEKGELNQAGYAFNLVKTYNRNHIKAGKSRIKEWDYYYFGDEEYGVALTIADNSYMALISASVLDFKEKKEWTKSYMKWFTGGSLCLPSTSEDGDLEAEEENKYNFKFINKNGERHLVCYLKNLRDSYDFHCDLVVKKNNDKSMVIATPFKGHPRHFYYNQKINLLSAKGEFKFGPITHKFNNALGVLDWGRGVWTYSNTWYWASLNGTYKKHLVGFNLGYGFGDTSAASENMFFYDDKAYKLEDVKFNIPTKDGKDNYLEKWTFSSENGDIDLVFEPLIDRYSNTNALIIQSNQHQVFGKFSGTIKVEGNTYSFDNLIGFAEKVKNRW